jgi:uncharacterized protein YkwD
VTSTLLGIAFAATLGMPQILPLTSAPGSALQQSTGPTSARMSVPNRAADTSAMLAALNARRGSKGLAALQLDPSLCAIAYEHAADMVTRSYFDHNTPEGLSPYARMDQAHYQYGYAGENIALDSSSAAAEEALWQSSEHRDNILGSHYAKVGISVVAGTEGDIVVEDFSD